MKKKNIFAAIDIGSHNCRLLIAEKNDNFIKIIYNRSTVTNLIKNLSYNNEFTEENISKTLQCLRLFRKKIDQFNISNYRCVATEACRSVSNPEFLVNRAEVDINLKIDVISSDEEARLCLISCKKYLNDINEGFLFDIGGGSTETTFFKTKSLDYYTKSISYGVINFPEKIEIFGNNYIKKKLQNHLRDFFNSFNSLNLNILTAIGSCSTVTTLCSIFQELPFYDSKKVEGFEMNYESVMKTIKKVENMSHNELRNHPCVKEKYKLFINGIKIMSEIIQIIPFKKLIVTQKGLRDAIIAEL